MRFHDDPHPRSEEGMSLVDKVKIALDGKRVYTAKEIKKFIRKARFNLLRNPIDFSKWPGWWD